MTGAVKLIWKVLIACILIPPIILLVIELFNVEMTGSQLATSLRSSIMMACDYYSQESYRSTAVSGNKVLSDAAPITFSHEDGHNTGNFNTVTVTTAVHSSEGDTAGLNGVFYTKSGTGDAMHKSCYDNLYGSKLTKVKSVFHSSNLNSAKSNAAYADYLPKRISHNGQDLVDFVDSKTTEMGGSQFVSDMLITPMNLGITYMDQDTLERICRYMLCQKLGGIVNSSSVNTTSPIRDDWLTGDSGTMDIRINYRGFLIRPSSFEITNIDYIHYDLTNNYDVEAFARLSGNSIETVNNYYPEEIIVASVQYEPSDIRYIGITAFQGILRWMASGRPWNGRVSGPQIQTNSDRFTGTDSTFGTGQVGSQGRGGSGWNRTGRDINSVGGTSAGTRGNIYYYTMT